MSKCTQNSYDQNQFQNLKDNMGCFGDNKPGFNLHPRIAKDGKARIMCDLVSGMLYYIRVTNNDQTQAVRFYPDGTHQIIDMESGKLIKRGRWNCGGAQTTATTSNDKKDLTQDLTQVKKQGEKQGEKPSVATQQVIQQPGSYDQGGSVDAGKNVYDRLEQDGNISRGDLEGYGSNSIVVKSSDVLSPEDLNNLTQFMASKNYRVDKNQRIQRNIFGKEKGVKMVFRKGMIQNENIDQIIKKVLRSV
jgi:hypothetical protein